MSKKIIVIGSRVPEVQKRIDESQYVTPWLSDAQNRYAEEVMRFKKNFKYWFDKYVKVERKK